MGDGEGAHLAALIGSTLLLLLGVLIDSTIGDSICAVSAVLREGEGGLSDVGGAVPAKKLLALLMATWTHNEVDDIK